MKLGKFTRKYTLMPNDSRKSFYEKAIVREYVNGTVLFSYGTAVVAVAQAGKIHRLWSGYSATTMHHVNAFMANMNIPQGGKTWWTALPCETEVLF